jgi:hypothetical protein
MKTCRIALFTCLALTLASGCGGDDDKDEDKDKGSGEGQEGCYFADENVCETYSSAIALSLCESLLGGTKRACPTENVEGVCVVQEEGETTTRHYYKGADGSAWEDEFGSTADDCEFEEGTYSAR